MAQAVAPGSRFSIPPFTDEVEQPENNDQITATAALASQVAVQGIIPFMQSDVVYGWSMEVTQTSTQTDGTTVTVSPYQPFIILGSFLLNMQYQYPSISVATGFDLALVNGCRPLVPNNIGQAHYKTIVADAPSGQTSQLYTAYTHNSGVAQTANFVLDIPASTWFDSYYELDETGAPLSGPHNGYVSPQNMGGYARVVTPSLRLNQLGLTGSATFDNGIYYDTGTVAVTNGLTTFGFSRIGVLGSLDSSVLPQPTNWQYNIAHQQVSLSGVTSKNIPLNGIFAGQIMGIYLRFFDPSGASGHGGAAINVTSIADILLQYGGSVVRWHGQQGNSILRMQRRFVEQHRYMPAPGVVIIDLAMDRQGMITNSYCLNTLRTAAVQLNLTFTSALSSTAYVEVTIDGLRWVPLPVNPNQ